MSDVRYGLPRDNIRKMKQCSKLTDEQLMVNFGISPADLGNARTFIAQRIEQMVAGLRR